MNELGAITAHEYGMAFSPTDRVDEFRWARAESRDKLNEIIREVFPDDESFRPRIFGIEVEPNKLTLRKNTVQFEIERAEKEWNEQGKL